MSTTPNMGLTSPTVSVTPGPDWANQVNSDLQILDQHTHSSGQGVQITPNGLNINTDLTYQVNNAISLRSVRFAPQLTAISGASDIGCLYESGIDLYYNDGAGNQIRITQSGSVAGSTGTITGLPSGTASASYNSISGTFIFQSSTNTPANVDGGSFIFRNDTLGSNGITVSPQPALASSYSITWPLLPSSQSFVTIDNAGSMGAPVVYPLVNSGIALSTITNDRLAPLVYSISASSGVYINTTTTAAQVTNLNVTLTCSGRPVMLMLVCTEIPPGSPSSPADGIQLVNARAVVYFLRNVGYISTNKIGTGNGNENISAGAFNFFDASPPVGVNTYQVYASLDPAGGSGISPHIEFYAVSLVAYEL